MLEDERVIAAIQERARTGTRGLALIADGASLLAYAKGACADVEELIRALREERGVSAQLRGQLGTHNDRLREKEREIERANTLWADRGHIIEELQSRLVTAEDRTRGMRQSVLEAAIELKRLNGPTHLLAKFEDILAGVTV